MKPKIRIWNNGFAIVGTLISGQLPLPSTTRFKDCGPTIMAIYPNCVPIHINKK